MLAAGWIDSASVLATALPRVNLTRHWIKLVLSTRAPGRFRPGVFVCLLFTGSLPSFSAQAEQQVYCSAQSADMRSAKAEHFIDGDTLRLKNGRIVRLIGINTPEMGRDGRPDQALAARAQRVASEWLADDTVLLHIGLEAKDRHGRLLASVFRRSDGQMLSEHLLRQGLGWQVTVPPNLQYSECLGKAEQQARSAGRGVWAAQRFPLLPADSLMASDSGFQRVRGKVLSVVDSAKALWIDLDNGLALRLGSDDRQYFSATNLEQLTGKVLTVRGWLIYRGKQKQGYPAHMMHLRHPAMLEGIEE